ncbi:MAG TPA: FAD-dependent oxidoreductase, partial [Actinomycetota bacterium]|nr:FAD-dependent oxidoreductase [Actinomycetota bacterium]
MLCTQRDSSHPVPHYDPRRGAEPNERWTRQGPFSDGTTEAARRMRTSADVVVVGGGVVGASAAYHLAAAGASVLLLERADQLGTGSTGACAGGFRYQFSSEVNIRLSLESVPMITGFEEEHGLRLDVSQDGYLFMIRSAESWKEFLVSVELQRSLGVEVDVLT